jgi:hypothetical protein
MHKLTAQEWLSLFKLFVARVLLIIMAFEINPDFLAAMVQTKLMQSSLKGTH